MDAELADWSNEVSGLLLYARTGEDTYPENDYWISGNRIGVQTLNLDGDFGMIKEQLNEIAERYLRTKVIITI